MDHDWEDKPLEFNDSSRVDMRTEVELDGKQVRFVNLMTRIVIMANNYRVCRVCAQESVDFKEPAHNCGFSQVIGIMEL